MKKAVWTGIIAGLAVMALSTPVFAQNTATVTVNATVAAKAKLTVSQTAISFADQDPDVVTQIPANTPIDITVKARGGGGAVTLTVQAAGNLLDGSKSIDISALKWTATGTSFNPTGTSNTSPMTVMSFNGSGNRAGTQNYTLDNSWDYVTGSYATSLTYTLTVP
jgi:hypothetical protein